MTRQLLGLSGIVLAVFGLAYGSDWLIWTAAGVLGATLVWRVIASGRSRRGGERADPPES